MNAVNDVVVVAVVATNEMKFDEENRKPLYSNSLSVVVDAILLEIAAVFVFPNIPWSDAFPIRSNPASGVPNTNMRGKYDDTISASVLSTCPSSNFVFVASPLKETRTPRGALHTGPQ